MYVKRKRKCVDKHNENERNVTFTRSCGCKFDTGILAVGNLQFALVVISPAVTATHRVVLLSADDMYAGVRGICMF